MSGLIEREALEAALVTSAHAKARARQVQRVAGIEDYLFIRGDLMTAANAAARLGVDARTITRYRAVLRAVTGGAA